MQGLTLNLFLLSGHEMEICGRHSLPREELSFLLIERWDLREFLSPSYPYIEMELKAR